MMRREARDSLSVALVLSFVCLGRPAASAQTVNWPSEGAPRPLPARAVNFPPYQIQTLPNGLQVVVVLHHEQPAVSMRLLVRAGSSLDPKGKLGVAHLTASLLDQGTTTKSAGQLNDAIDFIGGTLDAGAGIDLSFVNAVVMKDSFEIGLRMLSDGQSSRIYQRLVYEKRVAVAAFGGANLIEDPNIFFAVAIVQPGHTPEEAVNALIAELDRLKAEPISPHELQRAKNQFARDYILGRESNQQKALQLAHAVVIHHDIRTADGEFDIFQNITAADVQRVARTYFRPENRLVLTLTPSGKSGAQ